MSIYIGMGSPKENENIIVYSDGTAVLFNYVTGEVARGQAIEVPPHGALKDADALLAEIKPDRPEDFEQAVTIHVLKKALRNHINNAPTIIPADPAEEDAGC